MAEDKELTANLKLAKTKPMFFAFVAKGSEGKLLVDKKKISPKAEAEAKKACGGGVIFHGRVTMEGTLMVFEVGKEVSATLAPLTKKIIKQEAGLVQEVLYRVAPDLAAEDGETAETESAQSTAPPAPSPLPSGDAAARFAARLEALAPLLQKVEAANPTVAAQVKAQVGEGNKAYVAKHFDDANAALDRVEALLKQALASGTAPHATEASDAEKHLLARLKALEPALKKLESVQSQEAKDARQAIKEAATFVGKHDFDSANGTLDIAETLIKEALKHLPGAPKGAFSVMKLGKARIDWINARATAMQEIKRLQGALDKEYKSNAAEKETLANAFAELDAIFQRLDDELADQLDLVLNADPAQRAEPAIAALTRISQYENFIATDDLMKLLDGNEVLPDLLVSAPLRARLHDIAAALK